MCIRDSEIIEAISGYLSCSIQINAVKVFHNIGVIRNLKIRNQRLAELFDLYVLAVIFSNGYTGIDEDVYKRQSFISSGI